MLTVLSVLLPVLAVVATVEAIRTAPEALAHVRVRRRLFDAVGGTEARAHVRARRLPAPWIAARFALAVESHHRRSRDRGVPERLDRIVRRLRSGATLPAAIVGAGADDDVLGSLVADIEVGRPLASSVARWRDLEPLPNRRLAAVALELAADAGGASARVLDGVAESLRDRVALDREVAALSSQSRASAALLVAAPVVFALVAGAIEPRILTTLFASPIGWACLVGGIALDLAGAAWMAHMIGRHR